MSAFKKWLDKLQSFATNSQAVFTEQDVIYFRKAIGMCGIKNSESRTELRNAFWGFMPENGYRLTREQQNKGTQYLLTNSLKMNGGRRKGCKLGTYEIGILQSGSVNHTFTGLYDNSGPYNHSSHFLPIYRASSGGEWFEYIGTVYDQIEVLNIGQRAA